jgi:hypothetical protein
MREKTSQLCAEFSLVFMVRPRGVITLGNEAAALKTAEKASKMDGFFHTVS